MPFYLINEYSSFFLLALLIFLLLLNFNNKIFLGDSGSYLLSIFFGFLLIEIYNNNKLISPYFIALLLWYPCFENLFSIIRKFNINFSPIKPDNKHLHQLLYLCLLKKFKFSKLYANNLASIIINTINLIIISIGAFNYNHTIIQLTLIFLSCLIYTKVYLILLKILNLKKII